MTSTLLLIYLIPFFTITSVNSLINPEESSAPGLEEGEVELSKRGIGNRKRAPSPQKKEAQGADECEMNSIISCILYVYHGHE